MARKTFRETVQSWRLMVENARPLLAEKPHLAPVHAELDAQLAKAEDIERRLHRLRSEQRSLMRQRHQAVEVGANLRTQFAGGLVALFGGQSEQLLVFGVHPRPKTLPRRKKTKAARRQKKPPAPASPTASESVS